MNNTFNADHLIQEYLNKLFIWTAPLNIQDKTKINSRFYLTVYNQLKTEDVYDKITGVTVSYRKDNPTLQNLRGVSRVGIITSFDFYNDKLIWDAMVVSTTTAASHGLPIIIEKV